MLAEGKKAPAFTLEGIDENGQETKFALKDFLAEDKDLVLYFYPRDNTPGCTTQACDFRDNMNRITAKAQVVGISPDSIERHVGFREKHGLNFPLLSDPDKKVLEKYDAYGEKKLYGKTTMGVIRSTYIIGSDGRIKRRMVNVKAKGHVDRILEELG